MTNSADLIGTARLAALKAADILDNYYRTSGAPMSSYNGIPGGSPALRVAEQALTDALAECRAARWGVERRNPSFDSLDLDIILAGETRALNGAREFIPE